MSHLPSCVNILYVNVNQWATTKRNRETEKKQKEKQGYDHSVLKITGPFY